MIGQERQGVNKISLKITQMRGHKWPEIDHVINEYPLLTYPFIIILYNEMLHVVY